MINLEGLAQRIVAQHFAVEKAFTERGNRSKVFAVEQAQFNGLLRAADALQITNYGNGETGVRIDLRDILHEFGPRPPYRVVNNAEQHDYDKRVARELVRRSFQIFGE